MVWKVEVRKKIAARAEWQFHFRVLLVYNFVYVSERISPSFGIKAYRKGRKQTSSRCGAAQCRLNRLLFSFPQTSRLPPNGIFAVVRTRLARIDPLSIRRSPSITEREDTFSNIPKYVSEKKLMPSSKSADLISDVYTMLQRSCCKSRCKSRNSIIATCRVIAFRCVLDQQWHCDLNCVLSRNIARKLLSWNIRTKIVRWKYIITRKRYFPGDRYVDR